MDSVKERKADYDLMAAVMICLGKAEDSGTDLFPRATSQVAACRHLATAARVKYPAALQRCKFDTPLLAAGSLIKIGVK